MPAKDGSLSYEEFMALEAPAKPKEAASSDGSLSYEEFMALPKTSDNEDDNWDKEFAAQAAHAKRTRGPLETINDTVIEVGNSVAGMVGAAGDFIVPGNRVSEGIDNFIKDGEKHQSDVVRADKNKFQAALRKSETIGDDLSAVADYIISSPLQVAAQAIGSFGPTAVGMKAAKVGAGLMGAGEKAAQIASRTTGVGIGVAAGGGDAAGDAYKLVQGTPDEILMKHPVVIDLVAKGVPFEQIKDDIATRAARKASILPGIAGGVAGAFGAEKLLAGGAIKDGYKHVLGTGLVEGGTEAIEEGLAKYTGQSAAQQYNPTIDPTKNVAAMAAMGGVMGFGAGASIAAITPSHPNAPQPPSDTSQPAPDITASTNLDEAIAATQASVAPRGRADIARSIDAEPPTNPPGPSSDAALLDRINANVPESAGVTNQIQHGNPLANMPETSSGWNPHRIHPVTGVDHPHKGYDYPAAEGTPVSSTAEGVVKFAGIQNGYGNVVIIQHPNGEETRYAHLHNFADGLRAGDQVAQGQQIGGVGSTGLTTGSNLHYERRMNGQPFDYMQGQHVPTIARAEARQPFGVSDKPPLDVDVPTDKPQATQEATHAQSGIEQGQPIDLNVNLAQAEQESQPTKGQNVQDAISEAQSETNGLTPETGSPVGNNQEQVAANTSRSADKFINDNQDSFVKIQGSSDLYVQSKDGLSMWPVHKDDQKNGALTKPKDDVLRQIYSKFVNTQATTPTPTPTPPQQSPATPLPVSAPQGDTLTSQPVDDPLRPIRAEILKYKGEGKTKTGSKVFYDATDRLKAISEDTLDTSMAAQQVWFNSKRKILAKNGDDEAAALFEQVVAQIKAKIQSVKEPVATVASVPVETASEVDSDAAILVRPPTAKERLGGTARHRGFSTIDPRKGYEVVYKPYGNDGDKSNAGYYYIKNIDAKKTVEAVGGKEPWQMSAQDLIEAVKSGDVKPWQTTLAQNKEAAELLGKEDQFNPRTHKEIVESALKEGKDVPAEVLADYPDLSQVQEAKPQPESKPADGPSLEDFNSGREFVNKVKLKIAEWVAAATQNGTRPIDTKWERNAVKRFADANINAMLSGKQFGNRAASKIAVAKSETFADLEAAIEKFVNKVEPADEVSRAKEHLDAAGIQGKERLDAIGAVKRGDITAEDVAEAHAQVIDAPSNSLGDKQNDVLDELAKSKWENIDAFEAIHSLQTDEGKGFYSNDAGIKIIKAATKQFEDGSAMMRRINKFIAKRGNTTFIRDGFYDAVEQEFLWLRDYLAQAVIDYAIDASAERVQEADSDNPSSPKFSVSSTLAWPDDFPKLFAHTSVSKVTEHPDFDAAKRGDVAAATRLVADLTKPDRLESLAKEYPGAIIVGVFESEPQGNNQIPRALAAELSMHGLKVDDDIVSVSSVSHKNKDAVGRLLARKAFEGKVIKGAKYIIADDVVTQGGTIHELRHYIENNGGHVVAATSLAFSAGSNIIAIKQETLSSIQQKFNGEQLERILREENITGTLEALTESEGRAILRFGTLDAFRGRIAEARRQENLASNDARSRTPYSLRYAVFGGNQSATPTENTHTVESATSSMLEAHTGRIKSVLQAMLDSGKAKVVTAEQAADVVGEDALYAEGDDNQSPYRSWITKVRGGWTKEKIRKELKSVNTNASHGKYVHREIAKFDSATELSEHIFYHGTGGYVSGGLKPSITMSEREAESSGGGGYGERYWGVSLSKNKNIAANFTGQSDYGTVYPVILKKDANVISMPEIQDASELEDIIEDLWTRGIDAVKIGKWDDGFSEQEIVILNPRAIFKYSESESYRVFQQKRFESLTESEIEKIYEDSVKSIPMLDAAKKLPKDQGDEARKEVPKLKFAKDGSALAFYNPADGITYFIADHIPQSYTAKEWEGLVLHEIAVHARELGVGQKEFKNILSQVELMRKAGDKAVVAAFKRVPADTKPENVTEETLAYLLQNSPELDISQRFWAWFRNAIRAIGKSFPTLQKIKLHEWAKNLNESDLRFMAESALKNSEQTEQLEGSAKFSAKQQQFYSQLRKVLRDAPDKIFGSGKQVALWLQANHGNLKIKKDELHWSGILDWLQTQGKVSKTDVLGYLQGHGVTVQEVTLGKADVAELELKLDAARDAVNKAIREILPENEIDRLRDIRDNISDEYALAKEDHDNTKFASYVPPGGKPGTYRELLLTLPAKRQWVDGSMVTNEDLSTQQGREAADRVASYVDDTFTSSHYDQPNIVAHLRVDEVEGANGERFLRVIEAQSDWGQKGRKEGFKSEEAARKDEFSQRRYGKPYAELLYGEKVAVDRSIVGLLPSAPFVTDTSAWLSLALKKAISFAAQNGMDGIVFATGQQNADLYDLSKQVDRIEIRKATDGNYQVRAFTEGTSNPAIDESDVSLSRVGELVGKDLAKKAETQRAGFTEKYSDTQLKVGGEGMKAFYDKIVPDTANKVLKQIGADVKVGIVAFTKELRILKRGNEYQAWDGNKLIAHGATETEARSKAMENQPGFTITPALRAKVTNEGMPLFSKQGNTININGVERSRLNSNGKPIANTDEAIRNFYEWFGDSKVVDEQGRPLVIYHGTGADITEFNKSKAHDKEGRAAGVGYGQGKFYFTSDTDIATSWANNSVVRGAWMGKKIAGEKYGSGESPNIIPVYAKIKNPITPDEYSRRLHEKTWPEEKQYAYGLPAKLRDKFIAELDLELKKEGVDGIYSLGDHNVITFNPSQVKSSTGNNGNFSKSDNNILFSKSSPAPKNTVPEETSIQSKQRVIQDKFNRFKVLQDWLISNGTDLSEEADVYLAEGNMSGRVSTRTQDFRENQMAPLIKKTQKAGVSMEQIGDFLKMQHAPEANKRSRLIHDNPEEMAYGVSDKTAKAAMDAYKARPDYAKLKEIADEWRNVTNQTKKILLDSGIISPEIAKSWEDSYDVYVPVKGTEESTGTGKGLNVNGKQKARLGHGLRDEAILENIWRDHERAISLDEKNLVGKALIRFALEAKNDDIITVDKPVKRQVLKAGQSSYMVTFKGNDIAAFQNQNDARQHISIEVNKGGNKADFDVVKTTDPARVMMQATPMLADNEVNVYVGGHTVRIQINDEIAARAYTNLGVEHLNAVLSAGRSFNNWLSKVYTGYSPNFIFTNPIRDAIQGSATLTANYGAGMAAKVFANYPMAINELFKHFRKPGSSALVTDYRANGGSTGAAYLSDLERIGSDMQAAYDEYAGIFNTYHRTYAKAIMEGRSKTAANTIASLKSGVVGVKKVPVIGHALRLMERINSITENALRVATYHTLVNNKVSKPRAAAQAKNLMNFNRKGEISNQAGALFLFFNPGVQGSQVMYQTLFEAKHKGQARTLAGIMVLSAFAIAAMNRGGGDDDEEKWKNTPDHIKDGNIVFKIPGFDDYQATLTMPYGWRIFHMLGNVLSDYTHGEDGYKLGIRMASGVFANFSPVGNPMEGEHFPLQVMPTAMKMALGPGLNENSFGQSIAPQRFNDAKPDSQLMFRSTKGGVYAGTAENLNELSGGTKYRPGNIDVSPETLKFWVSSLTGGAGQAAVDIINLPMKLSSDASTPIRDMPVVKRFVREVGISDTRAAFWEKAIEAKKAANEFGEARRHRDAKAMPGIIDKNIALIALSKYADSQQKLITLKRDEVDRIRNDKTLSPLQKEMQTKKVEQEEEKVYSDFIKKFDVDTTAMKDKEAAMH